MPTSLLVDMLHIISIVWSVHVSDFAYCLSMLTALGPDLAYIDNTDSGTNLMKEAMPSLGQRLPLLPTGKPDNGVRQDPFHQIARCTEPLPKSPGLSKESGNT